MKLRRLVARGWEKRRAIAIAAAMCFAMPFVLVGAMALATPFPSELDEPAAPSLRVTARDGRLLREVRTDDGSRARPLAFAEYPKPVRDAVLAAEDRRFYSHHGVDVVAAMRAALADVAALRVVSGASTITMQLARTLRPHRRSVWGKLREAALAVRLEAALPKDRILAEYLNRVPFGPNLRGYAAASEAYFGTSPDALSIAQTALLAGLPRGPSLYAVTHHPQLAKRRRDRVLARMEEAGFIDAATRDRAIDEPIATNLSKPAFGAPHFVRALVQSAGRDHASDASLAKLQPALQEALAANPADPLAEITTTLDADLQRAAETAVTGTLATLAEKHVTAAATLVIDNATGDVLAYVGSPDFFDESSLGQNDGVRALRQPGSSLKPFVYAEAIDHLDYTAATLLPDVEIHIPLPGGGDYVPHDFDNRLRGPIRLRDALGNSLNVPAVYTLFQLGTGRVLERLHSLGFLSLTEDAEHYGPALALGDGEVTMLELANAYATLARGGMTKPLRMVKRVSSTKRSRDFDVAPATRAMDEKVAAILTDVLSDKSARVGSFGDQNVLEFEFDVAAKTGTSKGYRDNIAVGYTRAVTVVAWAGNFDGSSMLDVGGITGAGPIFHAVMESAMHGREHTSLSLTEDAARLGLERTAICPVSGMVETSACPHHVLEWLAQGSSAHAVACTVHVRARVERHDGLLAGPACSADDAVDRLFERWDEPYKAWAKETERPTLPEASSPACPIAIDGVSLPKEDEPRIAYPFDGERFVIDPERPSALQLLDIRVNGPRDVDVRVDGRAISSPYRWSLVKGTHTIVARSAERTSAPVHISVR